MDINLKTVFLALVLSSFVEGLFAFVTPFYLTSQGISLLDIGIMFSIASLAMVLLRIFLGAYTDIKGRKLLFAFSFFLQAVSCAFFPLVRSVPQITPLKILHDLASSIRRSLRSTIIFENVRKTYQKMIAWASGVELLIMACVNFGAAAILATFSFNGSFFLMAVLQFTSFVIVLVAYKEKSRIERSDKVSLKEMYDLHLNRNMWVIMFATALSTLGMMLSHGFAEPLYFQAKYALSKMQIGLIIGLHRLSLALPLFVTGTIMHKLDVKKAWIFSTFLFSLFMFVMGMVNDIFIAVPVWLLHDIFAGSIRVPSIQILTQLNARDDKRGKDVNTMELLSGMVGIVTPSLTGALITIQWDLIFTVGGFLSLIAAFVLYLFYK